MRAFIFYKTVNSFNGSRNACLSGQKTCIPCTRPWVQVQAPQLRPAPQRDSPHTHSFTHPELGLPVTSPAGWNSVPLCSHSVPLCSHSFTSCSSQPSCHLLVFSGALESCHDILAWLTSSSLSVPGCCCTLGSCLSFVILSLRSPPQVLATTDLFSDIIKEFIFSRII